MIASDVPMSSQKMARVVIVTNNPAPYRVPVFNVLEKWFPGQLLVLYCSKREPNREWTLPVMRHCHEFLNGRTIPIRGQYIHFNSAIFRRLSELQPIVVVTCSFQPAALVGYLYARMRGIPHIPMTDGTLQSEGSLSWLHRRLRHIVYSGSRAFIAASDGGLRLYSTYGVPAALCVKSCLAIDNKAYEVHRAARKNYDLLFCGRFTARKNPRFALDVAVRVATILRREVSISFVGSGECQANLEAWAAEHSAHINVSFSGFAKQEDLPRRYSECRIMLFPTLGDTWGVVANEAMACGVPVVVSEFAGVAGELVVNGENGLVLPLDIERWARGVADLLSSQVRYRELSEGAIAAVARYTTCRAAGGIARAVSIAMRPKSGPNPQ